MGQGRSQLKNFLYFLNSIGAKRPIKFSYVEAQVVGGRCPRGAREILMECVDNVPWEDKELALKRILEGHSNPAVHRLLERTNEWALAQGPLNASQLKLLGLLKGLLRPADYLFLERPEQDLEVADLELFSSALEGHIRSTSQVVFISGQEDGPWASLFSKRVERGPTMEFKLCPASSEVGHLRFQLPPGAPVKKIA